MYTYIPSLLDLPPFPHPTHLGRHITEHWAELAVLYSRRKEPTTDWHNMDESQVYAGEERVLYYPYETQEKAKCNL